MYVTLDRRAGGMLVALTLLSGISVRGAGLYDLDQQPILVIGASLENGAPPISNDLEGLFGGAAINGGSYLSLGDALVAIGKFVVNEAQSGATSFDRDLCGPDSCAPPAWQGYSTQLQKAIARVGGADGAAYVWIGVVNDCLHSLASGEPFGTPPYGACSYAEVQAYIDRVIAVAGEAQAQGLTPIFGLYPDYDDLDLPLLQQATGLPFVASEQEYKLIAETWERRLRDEVPEAVIVDVWKNFEHLGDGLHPTPRTSITAALRVALAIRWRERTNR